MIKNLGVVDRIIRFVLFDLLLTLTYSGLEVSRLLSICLGILSLYVLVTVVIGYSPIYHMLHFNTNNSQVA